MYHREHDPAPVARSCTYGRTCQINAILVLIWRCGACGMRPQGHQLPDLWTRKGATHDLVMRLMTDANVIHQRYIQRIDNYSISLKLLLRPWRRKSTAACTVRPNRKPVEGVDAKLRSQVFERRKGLLLYEGYKNGIKKPTLHSGSSRGGFIDIPRSGEGVTRKFCTVRDYS